MPLSLLSTKCYIPPARVDAVLRPRLTEQLFAGLRQPGRVALLSGPPGFGKTTLLSEFAGQWTGLLAWLSLDEGDNDPNRFWTYLIAACQAAQAGFGENALALLRAPHPAPEQLVPTLLINDLAALDRPFVLVLDDYHTIQNAAIHTEMVFLLEHLPAHFHLVIATRTDPPWPLSRLRARNRLLEIRAQELRFQLEESMAFLRSTMGLPLSSEDVMALDDRTEGWAAGLQLAGLSMLGRANLPAFIQAFTGSHQYIAEYLVDEVIKLQPEELQTFLLETAMLKHLTAPLCEAVTGCQDSQDKLKILQAANLFLTPLDSESQWFRYHHLFADLLKARLQSSAAKARLPELHRRAAVWYEQNGMLFEAVEHALAAQDDALVLRLVEENALPLILQAHVRTVERWLQAIPQALTEQSPRANLAYAWISVLRGMPQQAAPFLERLQAMFTGPAAVARAPALEAEWLALQAECRFAQGQPEESRDLARRAQALLPETAPLIRSLISMTLAKAAQLTLDYDQAAQAFQLIVQDARQMGDMTLEVLGTAGQAQMLLKQGRLHQTFAVVQEGIRRLEHSGKQLPFSATLYGELGQVYFHWGQFDQARTYLRRSMEISGKSGYSDPEIYYHVTLSKIGQMEGNLDNCVREMEQAGDLASRIPPAMVRENLLAQQVRVQLATGHVAAAGQLLASEGFSFGDGFHFPPLSPGVPVSSETGLLYNSALRIRLEQTKRTPEQTGLTGDIALAETVFQGEMLAQQLPTALETLLLLSQMHAACDDRRQSLAAAARAIALSAPQSLISPFLEEGMPAARLLAELKDSDFLEPGQKKYVYEILAAFPHSPSVQAAPYLNPAAAVTRGPDSGPVAGAPALVESLTDREREVLGRIAAGDSNQAIAEALFITVSAVKKHTANIYGKLGVNSRTQAVACARRLGLLAQD